MADDYHIRRADNEIGLIKLR